MPGGPQGPPGPPAGPPGGGGAGGLPPELAALMGGGEKGPAMVPAEASGFTGQLGAEGTAPN